LTWGFSIAKWFADWATIEADMLARDPRATSEVEAQCKQRVIDALNMAFGQGTVGANNVLSASFYSGAWTSTFM
jgi:hypothetical protein